MLTYFYRSDDFHFSEFTAQEVLDNLHMLTAKRVIFSGFSDDPKVALSQIASAKECLLQMNCAISACFALDNCNQLAQLLGDRKPFPLFTGTLKIQLKSAENDEGLDGAHLARILVDSFACSVDLCQMTSFELKMSNVRQPLQLMEPVFLV